MTPGKLIMLCVLSAFCLNGCVQFTQRDYDLQEKAYKRQQEEKAAEKESTLQLQW